MKIRACLGALLGPSQYVSHLCLVNAVADPMPCWCVLGQAWPSCINPRARAHLVRVCQICSDGVREGEREDVEEGAQIDASITLRLEHAVHDLKRHCMPSKSCKAILVFWHMRCYLPHCILAWLDHCTAQ